MYQGIGTRERVARNLSNSDTSAVVACESERLIGRAIRHKPPSAELRPDQKDSDSLPDYNVLDPLLRQYIETMATLEQAIASGVASTMLALRLRCESSTPLGSPVVPEE